MTKIRILLADDHNIFRSGIISLLESISEFKIAGEASDGLEAIDLAKKVPADVFLMDIHLPKINGLEATRKILEIRPELKILILSGQSEIEHIKAMVDSGAKGYLLKSTTIKELVTAIRTIFQGNSYFSNEITQKLFAEIQHPSPAAPHYIDSGNLPITDRELEILKYITEEKTNREIAEVLVISPRTVDTHRRNLLNKLNVKNTAGLVRFFMQWKERNSQQS